MIEAILGEAPFMEHKDFIFLLFRFILNGTVAFILIDLIYKRINQQREYLFTFYLFNVLIFFVSSLLSGVKMKTGFAFGLFAIFSILRYRTEQLGIKEMTFLFINIIIAVINSTVTYTLPLIELLFANGVIIGMTYFLEKRWLKGHRLTLSLLYDNVELISNGSTETLIEDLRGRTGLNVISFDIEGIDYLRDAAKLKVYYE